MRSASRAVQMIQKEVDAVNGGGKVEALHLDPACPQCVKMHDL